MRLISKFERGFEWKIETSSPIHDLNVSSKHRATSSLSYPSAHANVLKHKYTKYKHLALLLSFPSALINAEAIAANIFAAKRAYF